MCISAGMALAISAGVQAVGAIMQGSQAADAAEAQAREREIQAAQGRADAEAERAAGEVRADKTRKLAGMQKSQARSSLAKSGVVADAGTAQTIQDYIASSGEEDALAEIYTGQSRARRLEAGAATSDREAGYLETSASNAMLSGVMGAGKSVLGAYAETRKPGWKAQQ